MQEEVTQKTVALVFKGSKLTEGALRAAMRAYLEYRKQKGPRRGKIPVKKLLGQGKGASSLEIKESNIKSFERTAKKYRVDFAVKKDRTTEPPKYVVFFKGQDADAIAMAFREFVYGNEKRKSREPIRKKLARNMEKLRHDRDRERQKDRQRGQEL